MRCTVLLANPPRNSAACASSIRGSYSDCDGLRGNSTRRSRESLSSSLDMPAIFSHAARQIRVCQIAHFQNKSGGGLVLWPDVRPHVFFGEPQRRRDCTLCIHFRHVSDVVATDVQMVSIAFLQRGYNLIMA